MKLLQHKTLQNSGWVIGGKLGQMLISLVVNLLTARYLGPANYGLINYSLSYTAFFTSFCTLGINSLLVKELVDRPDEEGEVLGTAIVLQGISSILSAVTIVVLVCVIDGDEPMTILIVALCSISLLFTAFDTFRYWFQRYLKAKYIAISVFVAYLATAAYRIFLIIGGRHIMWFALVSAMDHLCVAAMLMLFYKKNAGPKLSFSWSYGKTLLSRSKHFILSGLMVAIYGQTDKMMLKQMLDVTQTGIYTTATTINNLWCFVLAAIIDSLIPSVMEAHKSGDDAVFRQKNRQLYAIVFFISMGMAVLFNIFAELAIWVLYGKAYLPAAMPLRIVSWYTAFSYLGVARDSWIICKNLQKHLFKIYVIAAVGNVLLNFLLIPIWGASGAALASLISQVLTGFVLPFFVRDLRENVKLMLEGIMLKDINKRKE